MGLGTKNELNCYYLEYSLDVGVCEAQELMCWADELMHIGGGAPAAVRTSRVALAEGWPRAWGRLAREREGVSEEGETD